uniref:Smr/MutS family protein n=1 Tax=Castellaniella defragrans TaxID=75697 RepID=UPI0033427E9B
MKASKTGLAELGRLRAEANANAAAPGTGTASRRRTDDVPDTASSRNAGVPQRQLLDVSSKKPLTTPLDATDRALWHQAMRFVQPLRDTVPRAPGPARLAPDDWLHARRLHAAGGRDPAPASPALPATRTVPAALHDPDAREFLRPGCGPDLLRGLRRGKWPVEATLDLHGSTLEQMDERMDRFLASCLEHGIRCVRVVHGKGYGSRAGVAVLKDAVRKHLIQLAAIQAWVQCGESEGGAGAVTALLRQTAAKDRP